MERMAACWRLGTVLRTFPKHGRLHLTALSPLSFLAASQQQGRLDRFLGQSQLTCMVRIPNSRQEMTFTKKRRTFKPCHKEDGISTDMALVYENNMYRYNLWSQIIVNSLAVPIYVMSGRIIVSTWHLQDFSITSGIATASVYIIMYTMLIIGVNSLSRRSIRRMYSAADATKFAAVVQNWRLMRETVHFDLSTVQRKPPGKVFGSFFGNISIKGRSFMVTPTDFVLPKFYNVLMGYDLKRSIDLDLIKDIHVKDFLPKPPKAPPKDSS